MSRLGNLISSFIDGSDRIGLMEIDLYGRILAATSRVCSFFKTDETDLCSRSIIDLTAPEHRLVTDLRFQKIREGEVSHLSAKKTYLDITGSRFECWFESWVICEEDGVSSSMISLIYQDESQRYGVMISHLQDQISELQRGLNAVRGASPQINVNSHGGKATGGSVNDMQIGDDLRKDDSTS